MPSHFLLLFLFAVLVSIVFTTLLRDDVHSQLRLGAYMVGGFVISALVLGWIMYPFPIGR